MSNKTSDKNVGSIEKDIRNIKQYINLVLDKGYCDCNELNVISTGKYCDGSKNVAYSMQNILAEREQKDKRIQELEEQVKTLDEAYTGVIKESKKWFDIAHNSIPKQVVIDKIEGLRNDIKLGNCRYPYINEHKIDVLQELLREDKRYGRR